MAISETQLLTWSNIGSQVQSQSTYETVRSVLQDASSPFHSRRFDVYLQGSYGNKTNIYADSDVDIVICLNSVHYTDTTKLKEDELKKYNEDRTLGQYTQEEFKREVFGWLVSKFGSSVTAGKKAIFISGDGNRRDTDVLVCTKHLDYSSYESVITNGKRDGIVFWTSDGDKIVNYPKQHLENCTSKNQSANSLFKPNIRVLKNMRNAMIDHGFLKEGIAPSYFLEGMLWNVPSQNFVASFQQTFENYMYWLQHCSESELVCANQMYYLLRSQSANCWDAASFNNFRAAATNYWNSG